MLRNALEGSGGNGSSQAYAEAFRIIMRLGVGDKSFIVRKSAARCLKAFANIGGPGLGAGELDNSASHCVKVSFSSKCVQGSVNLDLLRNLRPNFICSSAFP